MATPATNADFPMEKKQILLISGPTGAGKSTFLSCLHSADLHPQILQALPDGAANWSVTEVNDILKGDLSKEEFLAQVESERRVRLHYDITFIHSRGIKNYEDDPSLDVLQQADSICVVFIKPDYNTVKKQYHNRKAKHRRQKSTFSHLWARWGRKNLRRLKRKVKLNSKRELGDLYANGRLLLESYDMWHNYLKTLKPMVDDLNILILQPTSKCDEPPSFSILNVDCE